LILASGSPRRRELLAELGLPFEVRTAAVDETPQPGETPEALVRRLSREKALAVAVQVAPGSIILAADTIVVLGGQSLGKPANAEEATAMLRALRGRTHRVLTAITLLDTARDVLIADLAATDVTMRDYSEEEIAAYVASGDPFDKAGAYAIQGGAAGFVAAVDGDVDNVVGLPLALVRELLAAAGVEAGISRRT
jgi:septum formation protein